MLNTGSAVELEVLFDLRFLPSFSRFVDGKLNVAIAVRYYLRHERAVFSGYVFVVKCDEQSESHHLFIKLHPLVHFTKTNIAHAMVDVSKPDLRNGQYRGYRLVLGEKGTRVVVPFNKGVNGMALRLYGRRNNFSVLILHAVGFGGGICTATDCFAKRCRCVINSEGENLYAVAVDVHMLGYRRVRPQSACEHEHDLALFQHVRGLVAHACLRSCIRDALEPESMLIVEIGRAHV